MLAGPGPRAVAGSTIASTSMGVSIPDDHIATLTGRRRLLRTDRRSAGAGRARGRLSRVDAFTSHRNSPGRNCEARRLHRSRTLARWRRRQSKSPVGSARSRQLPTDVGSPAPSPAPSESSAHRIHRYSDAFCGFGRSMRIRPYNSFFPGLSTSRNRDSNPRPAAYKAAALAS